MLSENDVRVLYETAISVVERAMTQVTFDVHVVEAEQRCKILAAVVGEMWGDYRNLMLPVDPPVREGMKISPWKALNGYPIKLPQ